MSDTWIGAVKQTVKDCFSESALIYIGIFFLSFFLGGTTIDFLLGIRGSAALIGPGIPIYYFYKKNRQKINSGNKPALIKTIIGLSVMLLLIAVVLYFPILAESVN